MEIDEPYWTYCANHPRNNPLGVRVPVGPSYVDAGAYPYRRVAQHPTPNDGSLDEKLRLLDQLVRGDLNTNSRLFQVALVQDLGELEADEAVPGLVELAIAHPGESRLVAEVDIDADAGFDIGDFRETEGVRVEYMRLASLRALRRICDSKGSQAALDQLEDRWETASPEQRARINLAMVYILDYIEPP